MNVLVTTSSFASQDKTPLKMLTKAKIACDGNPYKRKLTEDEVIGLLSKKRYVGLLAGVEPLTAKVFDAAKDLKVISRIGVGMDSVDRDAAKQRGIKVVNTPDVLTDAVAE
ncbi:MAG: hydroxyacid dehydrogenase, partial [Candidatus Omnitrophica bacterium]|nr:hydroxyacid dehydrogenase [Candidatus Omnitrophota bacterium]